MYEYGGMGYFHALSVDSFKELVLNSNNLCTASYNLVTWLGLLIFNISQWKKHFTTSSYHLLYHLFHLIQLHSHILILPWKVLVIDVLKWRTMRLNTNTESIYYWHFKCHPWQKKVLYHIMQLPTQQYIFLFPSPQSLKSGSELPSLVSTSIGTIGSVIITRGTRPVRSEDELEEEVLDKFKIKLLKFKTLSIFHVLSWHYQESNLTEKSDHTYAPMI